MSESNRVTVIGGGPGGYTAAFLAADLGMEVTLIDDEPNPGGVCLYRGCMPSKALLHVAKVLSEAKSATELGISFGSPSIDLSRLRTWKNEVVSSLTGGLGQLTKQRKINYVQGRATLTGPHAANVMEVSGSSREVKFDHAILATGSRPFRPPAFAVKHERVLDSTGALDLPRVGGRLLVVGGGYIGLELGSVYAALGSSVSVVEMAPSLLPGVDADLVRVLTRRFEIIAETVHLNTTVSSLNPKEDSVEVMLDGQSQSEHFDEVLIAVGRVPNSDCIGLEHTLIEVDSGGFVVVNGQCQTAEPSVFAIGDLAGEPMLAHKAFHQARVAVESIAGQSVAFEPLAIPAVVFTDPEIAWCGLTESQAELDGRQISVARFPWAASGRAVTLGRTDGLTKLIVDPETETILGVGVVGVGAGELIAEGVVAIELGATVSDLKQCIHPHPTLSESLLESAESFLGLSTHVYKPKRA